MCAFELFALYLFIYLFEFFTFEEEVTFYHWKNLKKMLFHTLKFPP